MGTGFQIPNPIAAAEGYGYGPALAKSPADQLADHMAAWDLAYRNSKDAGLRGVYALQQKARGGTFDREEDARAARQKLADTVGGYNEYVDVVCGGYGAYAALMLQYYQGLGSQPDIANPPAAFADLVSDGPQPFAEWVDHDPLTGIACWFPLPGDDSPEGKTWKGLAKRTAAVETYVKVADWPNARKRLRWFVKK